MDLFYEKRSEALSIYKNFATMIRTQFDTSIFVLAREYLSGAIRQFLSEQGTLAQFSCPQNGVIERRHRHLLETARALMIASSIPRHFGLKLFPLPLILLIFSPHPLFMVGYCMSIFVASCLAILAFVFLDVCAMYFLHLVSALC